MATPARSSVRRRARSDCPARGPDAGGRALRRLGGPHRAPHRACPICDGAMAPRYGAGPSAVGGRCRSCRTELV